jgi:5-methylcytosine-specific restriction endonuclease McrA
MMDEIITEKICGKCKETKPITEFYKNTGHKNGFDTICKICHDGNTRRWAIGNREKTRGYIRNWTKAHAEEERERLKKYKLENKEKVRESNKKYSKVHAKQISDRGKKYQQEHPEVRRESARKWRAANREKDSKYTADKKARKLGNGGTFTADEWKELLNKYGNKCLCCGRNDIKVTIDHVVPLILGGRNSIENLQPLCKSCNSRKNATTIDYRP